MSFLNHIKTVALTPEASGGTDGRGVRLQHVVSDRTGRSYLLKYSVRRSREPESTPFVAQAGGSSRRKC